MANPNFDGVYSTHNIWRGDEEDRCLTDDLDAIEADIEALDAGKADADHTHAGYAADNHTHTPASIGAAPTSHSHDYAAPTHSHTQTEIAGLTDALAGKAPNSALTTKADLVDGKVPTSQLPSFVDDVLEFANLAAFPATGESGKIYVAQDTNKTYRWSGSAYVVISETIALGETSATAYRGDRGKTAYEHSQNGTVHVTADQKTAWDSKAAGNHGHSYNDLSDKPTIPAAYSHPSSHPASMITGLATVATSGNYADLSGKPTIPTIPSSLPANGGNADTVDGKHASDFATADHTHAVYGGNGASTYKKVWIATTGSDNNPGTAASPMATITGAIRKYSEKYKMLDISLADGTYNENLGAISPSLVNLAIRSNSEDKDAVTINMTSSLEVNVPIMRMYNVTLAVAATGVRPISVTGGLLYAYNVRINVPTNSGSSCVNVYNGCSVFMMHCVFNSGTSGSGAAIYGNQANIIKAINCTSERKVSIAYYAHNGTTIIASDTINAITKVQQSYYGKVEIVTE